MTDGCQVPEHSGPYQYRTDNARLILILLVVTDLIFIALHTLRWWFNAPNLALSIEIEGGYGEVFQYTKYLWAAILTGWFAAKNRAWRFASWSIVFLYFLADDSLAIHESLGALVAARVNFELPLGLEPVDFGDLTTLVSAAAALAILVFAAQLGAGRNVKRAFMEFAALAVILGFFSVAVDLLHGLLKADPLLDFMLGTLEDGGEMIAASLLVWYCFRLQNRCPVFFWRDES
ncbi:MAG: hypothetical protein ABL936_22005 [Aestuariivirga sp.]